MNLRPRILGLVALPALLLAALAFFYQSRAQAQPETEELVMRNPLIDCSTNPAYDNRYIASAFKAGGGHMGGRNQQCSACHKSDSPRVGVGDRPVATLGSALIQNRLSEPITYSVKFGKKGEWEKFELDPGAVRRHSYKYAKANQNRSPEVFLLYDSPKGPAEKPLTLVATPNPKLGSVYFFDKNDDDGKVYLFEPTSVVSRR